MICNSKKSEACGAFFCELMPYGISEYSLIPASQISVRFFVSQASQKRLKKI